MGDAEKWIIRMIGSILSVSFLFMFTILYDMSESIQQATLDVATIRKEMELVKPSDILKTVNEMAKRSLRQSDIEKIVRESAPWKEDKRSWERWRSSVEDRISDLETRKRSR